MSSKITVKKCLFSFLALTTISLASQAQEVYKGRAAHELYENAQVVRTSTYSNLPSYLKFQEGKEIDLDNLQLWIKKSFQLAPQLDWILIGEQKDRDGQTHYRYQQTWNGYPVDAAVLIAHTSNDKVYSINGNVYQNFTTGSSESVSENDALLSAMSHVGAETYKWESPAEEEHYKWEQNDPSKTYFPTGTLVLVSDDYSFRPESFRLAWKFDIYASEPVSRDWIYVDALTGEVIQENKILVDADEAGTAETQYSGDQTIIADSFGGGYRLHDGSRGDGVRTYDLNTSTTHADAVDFVDDDNYWDTYNPELDEYATDAHYGAEMTYDYYWLIHGRNSIDDDGYNLLSYVHYGSSYLNAFWDGIRMTYGDGSGGYTPLTTMDIAAHEITHGLTNNTANLIYYAESGALNESFSDIFGIAIENYATPGDWDWLMGEDIGTAFRSASNPNTYNDPDTYFGTYWASLTGGDSGGVHTNSGVQNFWYYLLKEGGTGTNDNGDAYDVTGQDWDVASAVSFRNLTTYLWDASQFADARFFAIQSALDIYGGCSDEVEAVTNAWYAVGVGEPYSNEVIADFEAENALGCTTPWTVSFTNLSVNGITYSWDFGDGGTSTETSPTHTYTAEGTYSVSLITDGGPCGIDDTIAVDIVIIDSAIPCEVEMPDGGVGPTQLSCEGTLYDSGGSTDNYGSNELSTITIAPTGASTVTLDFVMFDVESGTSGGVCDYDYLEVYDGPNSTFPLIDRYCNTNTPPASLTSTGGSVTFVFSSDASLQEPGFEIEWSCNLPTVPPVTDFMTPSTTSCTGIVNFVDLTIEGPTSWDWDFGDGGTSTDQNPSHAYTADGTYTVTLTTMNGIGTDDEVKTAYIVVDMPDAPVGTDDAVCSGNSADLNASSTGTATWYDVPVGGSPIATGGTYSTPPLTATTSYWVEDVIEQSPVNEGPTDNSFGGGGYFGGNQHLIFDVNAPCVLNTVKVFADGDETRTIELRNNLGMILESVDVFITDGEQIVSLGWDLEIGSDYQLGTEEDSDPDLYRNNSGPSYPYTVSGLVDITNSSAGAGYYYFFYDWELQEADCVSPRTEVVGEVGIDTTILIDPVDPICASDGVVPMTTGATGGLWDADCGGCIDPVTGDFDPSTAGLGDWTIDYVIPGYCGSSSPLTVTVIDDTPVNIDAIEPLCHESGPVILTTDGTGGSWSADCGSCIDATTGEFDPGMSGDGSWTVTYNLVGDCDLSNSITVEVISCLGIGENNGGLIGLYPNPAKELVTITTPNMTSGTIEMTDVLGRTVISQTINSVSSEVSLSGLEARSTYFVKIVNEQGQLVTIKKLVKQ